MFGTLSDKYLCDAHGPMKQPDCTASHVVLVRGTKGLEAAARNSLSKIAG